MEKLTGADLVAHAERCVMRGIGKREMAASAGYIKLLPNGKTRTVLSEFNEAMLEARGIKIGRKARPAASRGRALSYGMGVLKQGHAVISKGYLRQIGAGPFDRLSIEVKGSRVIISRGA